MEIENITLEGENPEERQEKEDKLTPEWEKITDENILGFIIKEEGIEYWEIGTATRETNTFVHGIGIKRKVIRYAS